MPDLKHIKIFLASSIVEFDRERVELQTYIARLNKEYIPRGIYFDLEVCENVTNALAVTRKQDEYNDIIRASRYVYLLVGEKIGQFTEEEFDVALDQFRKTGTPFIYTYFKRLPEGARVDQSVSAFMRRLGEGIGHYWSEYSDLDSIKLNIILELMRDPEVGGVVQFEDGRALLNGEEMVSLENVPIYNGNGNLQELKGELKQLDAKRAEVQSAIALGVASGALDPDLAAEFAQLSARREELLDQVHQMEMAMLENMNAMVAKSRSEEEIDPRERKAAELVTAGKYEAANELLSSSEWAGEIDSVAELMDGLRDKVRQYLSGQEALIANLESLGVNKDSELTIMDAYDRIYALAVKWFVGFGAVRSNAQFLRRQRRFDEALNRVNWVIDASKVVDIGPVVLARAYVTASDLYLLKKQYDKSEEANNEAIRLFGELAAEGSSEELELAHAYVRQSETLFDARRVDEAKEMADKGLEILARREAESQKDLGYAYNMLSLVEEKRGNLNESVSLMKRAIHYRAAVAQSGKQVPLRSLSISYANLAGMYLNMKRYDDAEEYFRKCLDIRAELVGQNPRANEAKYSIALKNYASALAEMRRFEEAERYADDAIEIRRRLAEEAPDVSTRGLAAPLHVKGQIILDAKWDTRYGEAKACLEEAYAIRKEAYESTPRSSFLVFCSTCELLARLYDATGEKQNAEACFAEAIEVAKGYYADGSGDVGAEYAKALFSYAAFLHAEGDDVRAEALMRESLAIREGLFERYPEIYKEEYEEAQAGLAVILA